MSTLTTYELNEQVAKRASEKEEFRVALLSDPKKALENEFGVEIPADLQIEVHLETKNTLHLIVPEKEKEKEKDTLELSDDQLDQVAGGRTQGSSNAVCVYGAPGRWEMANSFSPIHPPAGLPSWEELHGNKPPSKPRRIP